MDRTLWEKGLNARKSTLGAEYVEKSLSTADAFNAEFQDMLNEFCWGKIWGDSTIPPKIRSMMNLSLSFDHRALDGLAAARFLQQVKRWLEGVDELLAL